MNTAQKLGVVKALQKRLKDIESDLKADMRSVMPEDGGNANIVINGVKLGTVVLEQPTGKTSAVLTNAPAFAAWLQSLTEYEVAGWASKHPRSAERVATEYLTYTGERPNGVEFYEEKRPGNIKVTGVTFEKVDKALGGLAAPTIKLLEETND